MYYPHNLRKYEINGTLKFPISQLFMKIGKNLEVQPRLIFKKSSFPSFHELWKIEKSSYSNTQKFQICLRIGRNVEVQPKTNTQKFPILNIRMNSKNLF